MKRHSPLLSALSANLQHLMPSGLLVVRDAQAAEFTDPTARVGEHREHRAVPHTFRRADVNAPRTEPCVKLPPEPVAGTIDGDDGFWPSGRGGKASILGSRKVGYAMYIRVPKLVQVPE